MNKLLADLNVLNAKLHNFHYNVVGINFMSIHKMLEKEYDYGFELIDEVAEQIKIQGEYPASSLKEYLELSTINEVESKDYNSEEILVHLINDYELILESAKKILSETSVLSTENLMNDIVDEISKKLWFFNAMTK
ncbi:MAG: Dps family protein [Mycoplasmatales bacterium]